MLWILVHSLHGAARWQNDTWLWLEQHIKVALMWLCVYLRLSIYLWMVCMALSAIARNWGVAETRRWHIWCLCCFSHCVNGCRKLRLEHAAVWNGWYYSGLHFPDKNLNKIKWYLNASMWLIFSWWKQNSTWMPAIQRLSFIQCIYLKENALCSFSFLFQLHRN